MIGKIHPISGVIGFLTILTFWTSTAISELFGTYETVAAVKQMVLYGMFILVPSMAIVGASGMKMGSRRKDAPGSGARASAARRLPPHHRTMTMRWWARLNPPVAIAWPGVCAGEESGMRPRRHLRCGCPGA